MNATLRPWRYLRDEGQFIVADKDRIVAEIPCQGCNPEDGELIVRAVNSFDDLLAACKDMLEIIEERNEYISPNPESERPEFRTLCGCVGKAAVYWRSAIAKAELP